MTQSSVTRAVRAFDFDTADSFKESLARQLEASGVVGDKKRRNLTQLLHLKVSLYEFLQTVETAQVKGLVLSNEEVLCELSNLVGLVSRHLQRFRVVEIKAQGQEKAWDRFLAEEEKDTLGLAATSAVDKMENEAVKQAQKEDKEKQEKEKKQRDAKKQQQDKQAQAQRAQRGGYQPNQPAFNRTQDRGYTPYQRDHYDRGYNRGEDRGRDPQHGDRDRPYGRGGGRGGYGGGGYR